MTIEESREHLVALNEQANAIRSKADEEKRDITDEEQDDLARLLTEFDKTNKDLEQREKLEAQNKSIIARSRSFVPDEPGNVVTANNDDSRDAGTSTPARRTVPAVAANVRSKWGFQSLGEQAVMIKRASRSGGFLDPRLEARAPTTFGSEGVGADGGFAVAPDFRNEIMQKVTGEESLLSRCDSLTSSSNQLTVPKDETTPWQTSGGILATWEGENAQLTQSKPSLEQSTIRLNKLSVLIPVTEELLEDAPALDSYLRRKVPEKMGAKIDQAIISGTGVGMPLGIINAPGTKSVAKEGSQTADTVVRENVQKMYNAMWATYRGDAVWLANQDVETQLQDMYWTPSSLTEVPVFLPPGGYSEKPYGTLFARPVIYHQACETVGDLGDILFVNLKQYVTVQKTGGIRADTSMHLWFDYDALAFRFIFRIGGQPWWSSTIAARDGSATYSPHVSLAVRA